MSSASKIKRNILANFLGRICISVISLAFVPVYIKILGIEAYGLIGVYVTLTGLLAVFDLGLGSMLTRELARLTIQNDSIQEASHLVRTVETLYWGIGIAIGVGIWFLAPWIANHWIHSQTLEGRTVEDAIRIMGLIAACEWPIALYTGGLNGLQKQVLLNQVRTGAYLVQYGGAALILWLVAPTISAYFRWQILISATQVAVLSICLWKSLPRSPEKPRFHKSLLRKNWKFAAGVTGITITVTILTQMDKILLSKFLTLEFFGYYSLAFSISMALGNLVSPVTLALFPRYTQLIAESRTSDLNSLYHQSCQILAVIVLPVAASIGFYSKEILTVWIREKAVVDHTALLLSLLVAGMAINALVTLPYTMQLAHGWTRLSFYKNVVAVIILTPLLYFGILAYGATGAALSWIMLNMGYLFIEIPIMHKRILKKEMRKWYLSDVALPSFVTITVFFLSRLAMPETNSDFRTLLWVSSAVILSALFNCLVVPYPRFVLFEYIDRFYTQYVKQYTSL